MFIMDAEKVYVTNFSIFQKQKFNWTIIQYDTQKHGEKDGNYLGSIQVAQHQNMIYVLKWIGYQANEHMFAINLQDASIKIVVLPMAMYNISIFSIVADDERVYILAPPRVYVYYLAIGNWSMNIKYPNPIESHQVRWIQPNMTDGFYNKYPIPATISNDNQYIYMFNSEDNSIVKFCIPTGPFEYVRTTFSCPLPYGHAITAENGIIYLHGCDLSPGHTIMFDPVNEIIQNNTIKTNMQNELYSHYSYLSVIEDNLLLLSTIIDATQGVQEFWF
eukprot:51735_1